MVQNKLSKKIVLIALLLLALWLLIDDDYNNVASNNRHHLAVWTALSRHPPCLRIYRALLEFNLMMWGLALSLWLWKNTVGDKMTGYLLFQQADHNVEKDESVYFTESFLGRYQPLHQDIREDEDFGDAEGDFKVAEGLQLSKLKQNSINGQQNNDLTRIEDSDDGIGREEISTFGNEFQNDMGSLEHISPPPALSIAYAASDFLILILLSLFLFTLSSAEGGRYVDGMESISTFRFIAIIAAPIFPLVLFLMFSAALFVPWNKRRSQWKILSYTIGAPLYHVTFRDGFIGDILTSSVRPLQDVAFTAFYLFSGLQGWWQQSYDLDRADLPLESNWFFHTMILPMCMMSPLWYRFCQNLRQTYENKKRWPYLGNAMKYFVAAEVGIVGVYMQSKRQSTLWLLGFVSATLYQIWWDVFMDWNLLQVSKWKHVDLEIFQRIVSISIPTSFQLRKTRIYSVTWLYWSIFFVNIILRFCWTISFLPPHYLNKAGVLSENFEGELSAVLNPIIASAEIIRRTVWGWLRVEWEAIVVARKEPRLRGAWTDHDKMETDMHGSKLDSDPNFQSMVAEGDISENHLIADASLPSSAKRFWNPKRMYEMTEIQILSELSIYAIVFTAVGLLAAAHRETF